MKKQIVASLLWIVACGQSLEAGWLDRKAEGWAWYEEQEQKEEVKEAPVQPTSQSATEKIKSWSEKIEELKAEAILKPTPEKIGAYIAAQKELTDTGQEFAQVWTQYILNNPLFDETLRSPVDSYAVQIEKSIGNKKKKDAISRIGQEFGLFFFFESKCSYSQAFSEQVKSFSNRYNWKVIPVSLDGKACIAYPEFVTDNGISEKMGVKAVPALFAVNPQTEEVFPIAYGAVSLEKLEDNTLMQFAERYGEVFDAS